MRAISLVFILCGAIASGFAWSSFSNARLSRTPIHGDATHYVEIYRGVELDEVDAPFRFRVFTPYLARWVPPLPSWLAKDPVRGVSAEARVVFRFGVLNALGLAVAGLYLFLLLDELGFTGTEGLVGSTLFLTSYYPALVATTPLVDAWAYAFLAMGLYALLAKRPGLLILAFTLGLFNKEPIFLLPLAAVMLPALNEERRRWALLFLPPLTVYLLFRLVAYPAPVALAEFSHQGAYMERLLVGSDFLTIPKDFLRSFHVLWVLAAIGWTKVDSDSPLYRWRWLTFVVVLAPFVLVKSLGRTWSFAFPFVLPLTLLGIRGWMSAGELRSETKRPS